MHAPFVPDVLSKLYEAPHVLILPTLETAEDEATVRYLLAGTEALLGHPRLGRAVECPDPEA